MRWKGGGVTEPQKDQAVPVWAELPFGGHFSCLKQPNWIFWEAVFAGSCFVFRDVGRQLFWEQSTGGWWEEPQEGARHDSWLGADVRHRDWWQQSLKLGHWVTNHRGEINSFCNMWGKKNLVGVCLDVFSLLFDPRHEAKKCFSRNHKLQPS